MKSRLIHIGIPALICLGALAFASTPARAQTGKIYGTVTDPNGTPLGNVEVYLKDTNTDTLLRPAKTNKRTGRYLYMAPAGSYLVIPKLEGYLVAREIADIIDGSGEEHKYTWFFDAEQKLDKAIHVLPTGDLTSRVKQTVDFVLATPSEHTAVVNKLYAEYKGVPVTPAKTGEGGAALPGKTPPAQKAPPAAEKRSSFDLATDFIAKNDYAGALPLLQKAVTEDPNNADAYYQLGKASIETGDLTGAVAALNKAKELEPKKPGVSFRLAQVYDKKGRKVQALQAIQAEAALSPDSEAVLDNEGRLYAETGDTDNAIATYKHLLDVNPKYFDAYAAMAAIYKQKGDKANEEAIYQKMGDMDPSGNALYNLGNMAFNRDDREKASFYYKRVLEKNPKHAMAHYQLANTLLGLGDIAGAVEHFQAFLKLSPHDAKAAQTKATVAELKKLLPGK